MKQDTAGANEHSGRQRWSICSVDPGPWRSDLREGTLGLSVCVGVCVSVVAVCMCVCVCLMGYVCVFYRMCLWV